MHRMGRRAVSITSGAIGCGSDVLQWLVKEQKASPGALPVNLSTPCYACIPPLIGKSDRRFRMQVV